MRVTHSYLFNPEVWMNMYVSRAPCANPSHYSAISCHKFFVLTGSTTEYYPFLWMPTFILDMTFVSVSLQAPVLSVHPLLVIVHVHPCSV